MKKIIILMLLIMGGCRVQPKSLPKSPPKVIASPAFEISEVVVEPRVFNPNKGERVIISYSLSRFGKSILKLFDPQMRLVKDLPGKNNTHSRLHKIVWDGRDLKGNIVPDEAYFFTIEAIDHQGNITFYDPTTLSGGECVSPQVNLDSENKVISYELAKDARVMIRAGITGGPLLEAIINWCPRLAGFNEESWDGQNKFGFIDIVNQKGFRLMSEAITLPENSILAFGNSDYTYYEYNTAIAPERPKKKERPPFKNKNQIRGLHTTGPKVLLPEPKFYIQLPDDLRINEQGLPIVQGKIPIKIGLDEKLKKIITEQRYEFIFFIDFNFISEEEGGYSPYKWMWDTEDASNGEHIITVNVCTLKGGLASKSMKVVVEN